MSERIYCSLCRTYGSHYSDQCPCPPQSSLAPAQCSVEAIAKARDIITERMLAARPTLVDYLHQQAKGEEISSKEHGMDTLMGAYRAGSSNAYCDIWRKLEQGYFNPPNS